MIRKLFLCLVLLFFCGSTYFGAVGQDDSGGSPQSPPEGEPPEWGKVTRLIVKLADAFYQQASGVEGFQGEGQEQAGFLERLSQAAEAGLGRAFPLEFVREMSGEAIVMALPEALPEEQVQLVIERLQALPEVEYAEPDRIRTIALTPNDTHFYEQWNLFNPATGFYGINAEAAWNITTGSS